MERSIGHPINHGWAPSAKVSPAAARGKMMNSFGSIKLPIPCIRGGSGPHLQSFQTVCPPSQLISLLGHDPRSSNWKSLPAPLRDAYEEYQRKTKPARSEGISKYIAGRLSPGAKIVGAFPSLSIGLTEAPSFEPLRTRAGISIAEGVPLDDNIGTLYLDIGTKHVRMLLDGLARLTGAMEPIDAGEDVDNWFSFALTIFAPRQERGRLTPAELGQLFFDFNYRVSRVSPSLALEMDQAGIYSQIVEWLKDQPVIRANGGMQQSGASLGKKSTALVVRRVLHGFVTVAAEGDKALQGTKSEEIRNPRTTQDNIEEVRAKIADFLERFAEAMGDRFTDRDSIHLTRLGWEAIGMIAHEIVIKNDTDGAQRDRCAEALALVDWSRTNRDWFGMIGMAEQGPDGNPAVDEQGRERVVIIGGKGDQGLRRAINYLRKKVGLRSERVRLDPGLFEDEGRETDAEAAA